MGALAAAHASRRPEIDRVVAAAPPLQPAWVLGLTLPRHVLARADRVIE